MNKIKTALFTLTFAFTGGAVVLTSVASAGNELPAVVSAEEGIAVESVSLDQSNLSMVECESKVLTASILPANATNQEVTWSSSDEMIAVVRPVITNDGSIKGKITVIEGAIGTATITVTTSDGNKTATCTVTAELETYYYKFAKDSLPGTSDQGDDTGIQLFSDTNTNWTLFSWAQNSKNPNADKNATLYQCVADRSTWLGIRVDADSNNSEVPNTGTIPSVLRPRFTWGTDTYFDCSKKKAQANGNEHESTDGLKHPFYLSRNGSTYKYSFDGENWTSIGGTLSPSELARIKNAKLTVGFDYKRANNTITTEKYRFLKTDYPVCVALAKTSEYSFAKQCKKYDADRQAEYIEATRNSKIVDATIVKVNDNSFEHYRSIALSDITYSEGYDNTMLETFLTKHYGNQVSTWDNDNAVRGWALIDGTYYVSDSANREQHEYEFPRWMTSFKYKACNNTSQVPADGQAAAYLSTTTTDVTGGVATSSVTDTECKYAFEAVYVTKYALDSVTKKPISGVVYKNELSVVFDYYEAPATQEIDSYTFDGWYLDEDFTIPATKQAFDSATILYGKYICDEAELLDRFCQMILDKTDTICATNQGQNADKLIVVWKELYQEYSQFPDTVKQAFANLAANQGGTVNEQAAARYDEICRIYGEKLVTVTTSFSYNFASRDGAAQMYNSPSFSLFGKVNSAETTAIATVGTISLIMVVSLIGYVVLRKKKEN